MPRKKEDRKEAGPRSEGKGLLPQDLEHVMDNNATFNAFCLAAPRSGEGKTTAGIALMRALARRGRG